MDSRRPEVWASYNLPVRRCRHQGGVGGVCYGEQRPHQVLWIGTHLPVPGVAGIRELVARVKLVHGATEVAPGVGKLARPVEAARPRHPGLALQGHMVAWWA